jgi:hypothetical protein
MIAGVRINVRHRNQWAYLRIEQLAIWAVEHNEPNVNARLEELARRYFDRPVGAAVRIGTGQFGGRLLAVWMNDQEAQPTFEPEFDGTPDAYRPIVAQAEAKAKRRARIHAVHWSLHTILVFAFCVASFCMPSWRNHYYLTFCGMVLLAGPFPIWLRWHHRLEE